MSDPFGFIHYQPYSAPARVASLLVWLALVIGAVSLVATHTDLLDAFQEPGTPETSTLGEVGETSALHPTYVTSPQPTGSSTVRVTEIDLPTKTLVSPIPATEGAAS